MNRSSVFVALAVVAGLMAGGARAAADPGAEPVDRGDDLDELVEPAPPTRASYERDRATSSSHLVPVLEILGIEVTANLVSRAAGQAWADVSLSTMRTNLTREWVYDDDVFSVNQLAHPYGGALLFDAARSSGHGFWTSAAYGFAGSLAWETLAENEPPSINDQLTTSIAGAILGEALHRWGHAVQWGGGRDPGVGRQVLSALIDPMGAANRGVFGERWRRTPPPRLHAFLGAGVNRAFSGADSGVFHGELAVTHGLASDRRFVPKAPFHHFELRGQLDAGGAAPTGYLDARGLVVGDAVGGAEGPRALWGLYATYDYWDAQAVRSSAIGVGAGATLHVPVGDDSFVDATGVLAVVPWGAAGGTGDVEHQRDYQHGPGATQQVELRFGKRGVGAVRLSGRAIEVYGDLIGDGNEAVLVTSGGVMAALSDHHAIGVDVVYSAHHASVTDAAMSAFDQAAQVRVMYAITSGDDFGADVGR